MQKKKKKSRREVDRISLEFGTFIAEKKRDDLRNKRECFCFFFSSNI